MEEVSIKISGHYPMVTTIAGESGSGKSTFANILLGLAKPTGGAVHYKENDISRHSRADFAQYRREVQAIFQDPYEIFNPVYMVDNLFMVAVKKFDLARSKDEAMALIEEALRVVRLRSKDIFGKYPNELCGGQRQRLMVARAYPLKPKLIVADEPVSMVDASLRLMILDLPPILWTQGLSNMLEIGVEDGGHEEVSGRVQARSTKFGCTTGDESGSKRRR